MLMNWSSELIEDFNLNVQDKSLKNAIDTFKREYITKILEENGWNQTKTAKVLGIQRTYVVRLINELNIRVNKVWGYKNGCYWRKIDSWKKSK